MGLEIRYCDLCRSRISPLDIEAGKALTEPGRAICPECCKKEGIEPGKSHQSGHDSKGTRGPRSGKADSGLFNPFGSPAEEKKTKRISPPKRLPRQEKEEPKVDGEAVHSGPAAHHAISQEKRDSSRSGRTQALEKKPNYQLIGGAAAAGLLLLIVLALVMSGGGGQDEKPQDSQPEKTGQKKPQDRKAPPPDLKLQQKLQAEKSYSRVSDFDRSNPGKWGEAREKYQECLEEVRGTEYEKKILARIEEGDRKAQEEVEAVFAGIRKDMDRYLSERNFKFAAALFDDMDKYSGNQAMLGRALELRTSVLMQEKNWNEARAFPTGTKLSFPQERALYALFTEAGFDLAAAPMSMDAGWKATGDASWSFDGGVLSGKSEKGPGSICFGDPEWTDYSVHFEFSATSEKAVHFMSHCEGEPSAIDMKEEFKPNEWFQVRMMIWGDFMFVRFFDKARVAYKVIAKSCIGSDRGGFGFRLAEQGHELKVRGVKYRLMALPDKPYVEPSDGWHSMHESGMDLQSAAVEADAGCQSSWTVKDGKITGSSETGGAFLVIGSPSWTRFEFAFEASNAPKGARFVVNRPVNHLSLSNGQYLTAVFDVAPDKLKETWKDVRIVAGQDKAVLTIGTEKIAESAYQPLFSEGLTQAVKLGFSREMAGGTLQIKHIRVRIEERGGGF